MIALPLRVWILLILPTITIQTRPPHSDKRSPIDWTQCGDKARCFCMNEDLTPPVLDLEVAAIPAPILNTPPADQGRCNIGLQIKVFTTDVSLIQLQVIDGTNAQGANQELGLYISGQKLFACDYHIQSKTVVLVKNADSKKHRLHLFEDRSRFQSGGLVVCAVKIGRANFFTSLLQTAKVTIKFNSATYTFVNPKLSMISQVQHYSCDPFTFNDILSSTTYVVRKVQDRDRDVLNCKNYGPSYKMRYQTSPDKDFEMEELRCHTDPTSDPTIEPNYYFKLVKEGKDATGNPVQLEENVDDPKLYIFYCAANFNEICKNPDTNCPDGDPKCPVYKKGAPGEPATLKCDGRKWLIDDEYYELDQDPICKRDEMYENGAAFYTTFPSGPPKKTPGAQCFTEYDCKKKSKLHYSECDDEAKCGIIDYSNGVMKCKNETKKMKIHSYETNETMIATSYTCNKQTGEWKNVTGQTIASGSRISCVGDEIPPPNVKVEARFSESQVIWIIIGIFSGLGLLCTVCPIGIFCCVRRRKLFALKGLNAWKKLDKDGRLEHCHEVFSNVLQATPTIGSVRIVHGFDLLELLLKTENEDAKVWEDVYPFLMRFQGAIEKIDRRINDMFCRYMYLQAKKIVDKHGWTTTKPIRRNNEKGLLRSAAIQMLSFAMYNPNNIDAEKLIIRGYRNLGFKGRSQYPHSGIMWSMLMHARARGYKNKKTNDVRVLNTNTYMEKLRKIAFEAKIAGLPANDVIPEFGNVSQQAAFALGSSPNHYYHAIKGEDLLLKPSLQGDVDHGTVARAYFEGMCMSLSRNPAQTIIEACDMWPEMNPTFLEKLYKVAPESAWNEQIKKTSCLVTYYGRHLDAKRMQERFMPKEPELGLSQLCMDQRLFEEAVGAQVEELRAWFAKRTDIELLKKKPNYLTATAMVNLDACINANEGKAETTPAGAGGAPASGSSSSSAQHKVAAPASGSSSSSAEPKVAAPTPNPAVTAPVAAGTTPNPAAPIPNATAPAAAT